MRMINAHEHIHARTHARKLPQFMQIVTLINGN
jgi:hypothetical protein